MNIALRASIVLSVVLVAAPLFADTYHYAEFSGQLNGGSANVRAPFNSVLTQGAPISGHFVYDDQLIPSTLSNVRFADFPDIGLIDPSTAFSLDLGGGLQFDLSSPTVALPAIQYNNGQFNGFFFVSDFTFLGNPYRFNDQGGSFNIRALNNGVPSTTNLVTGRITIGDANLSGIAPYDPNGPGQPVPEPSSLLFMVLGAASVYSVRSRVSYSA